MESGSDWCYSGPSREKDLLQKKFGVVGVIVVFPAQNFKERL